MTIEKDKLNRAESDDEITRSWQNDAEQVELFMKRMDAIKMSRRKVLGIFGATATAAILAACGAAATNTPAAPAATTAAAKPTTAGATAAPGATTAAAPAAPTAAAPAATTAAPPAVIPGVGTGKEELAAEQVLRRPLDTEPASHDFNLDLYCNGYTKLFAGLLNFNADFEAVPYAAEKFEVKDSGAKYVFYLNQKGTWTNGDPVTADDFVWSFTRQLNPDNKAAYAGFLYDIKNAESFNTGKGAKAADLGLKAIDKYTLEVTLEGPRGYFPTLVAYVAALPAHKPSVEKFADKWTEAANIVTNGPFKLTKWEHQKLVEVERWDGFALGPKPKLQKITMPIIPPASGLLPYENNEVDIRRGQGVPVTEIPRLLKDDKLSKEFINFSASGLWYLEPVANKPPFDNVKVRQAVMHAVNRDQLSKVLNGWDPAYSMMAPDMPGYIDPKKYPELTNLAKFDATMAKDMLKGTPFEGGKGWPAITLTYRDEGATADNMAQFIQSQLKTNIGMEVKLEKLEQKVFRPGLYDNKFQFVFIRWYMDYPDPNNFYFQVWYSKFSSGHRHNFSDTDFDAIVTKAAGEIDKEKRAALYRDGEKILLDKAAYVPLVYGGVPMLIKPNVKGLPVNKNGFPVPNWNIYVSEDESMYIVKK